MANDATNPELSTPVSELGLSVRSLNCLRNAGIGFTHQLVEQDEAALMGLRNFGRKCLMEIKEILAARGLCLGMRNGEFVAPEPPEPAVAEPVTTPWEEIPGDSRAERIYNYKAVNPHLGWVDVARASGVTEVERVAKKWAKRNNKTWPLDPKRARTLEERQASWQSNTKSERAYTLRQQGLEWGEIDQLLGGGASPSTLAEKYAHTRGLPWPLLSTAEKLQKERDEADGAWLYQQALLESQLEGRIQRTIEEFAEKVGRDSVTASRLLREHAERNGLKVPKRKNRDQVFGKICYDLRKKGLTWREVAENSGIGLDVHACEAARRYAWGMGQVWPIVLDSPNKGGPQKNTGNTKKAQILAFLEASPTPVSRRTLVEKFPLHALNYTLREAITKGQVCKIEEGQIRYQYVG